MVYYCYTHITWLAGTYPRKMEVLIRKSLISGWCSFTSRHLWWHRRLLQSESWISVDFVWKDTCHEQIRAIDGFSNGAFSSGRHVIPGSALVVANSSIFGWLPHHGVAKARLVGDDGRHVHRAVVGMIPRCAMYGIFAYTHMPQKLPSFVGKYSSTTEHLGYGDMWWMLVLTDLRKTWGKIWR